MQKVIIDTNVLISALIQKSFPYQIIDELFIEQRIELCISENIFAEYLEVLSRPKFAKYPDFVSRAENLLAEIEAKSLSYKPKVRLDIIKDKDDNKFLELADECSANFIITGNTNDFTEENYKQTKIVTPKFYWERFRPT